MSDTIADNVAGRDPGPVFVSGTGTDAGKTLVCSGLVAWARRAGHACPALKPIETGCQPRPLDADRLAQLCAAPGLADDPDFYRVAPALSPLAVELEGGAAPLDLERLAAASLRHLQRDRPGLVEGAGGLLVPLTPAHTVADLVERLQLPLLLVAPNRLGVLSDVLATAEAAARRGLDLRCVVLNQVDAAPDPSRVSNRAILAQRLACPVVEMIHITGEPTPAQLAAHVHPTLLTAMGWLPG